MTLIGIKRAVITSAGNGTRMRPISNVIPKALLPIFKTFESKKYPTPLIELVASSLKDAGVSQFCVVVGTKGRMLSDYLFEKNVTFVFQKEPKGFGDAVLQAEEFASSDPFFLHVDDGLLTGGYREAASIFCELEPDCLLFLSRADNPKAFGVVDAKYLKDMQGHKVFTVNGVQEKPQAPKSDMVICGMYIFSASIFEKIRESSPSGDELQLTPAIQKLIEEGKAVYGMLLEEEKWLDLGNPDNYFHALSYSYQNL
ncbi:MAG: nucleotidyltransferase family protein [Candidatus Micrarchaeaceae archaeon]